MSPLFILDDSSVPARYGVTASLWANQLGLPLWSLRPDFDRDFHDSHQHVARAGYCVTSGLYRSDTLQQEVVDPDLLPTQDAVVVLMAAQAQRIAMLAGQRLLSTTSLDTLTLRDGEKTLMQLYADGYGRWATSLPQNASATVRIGLIGRKTDHRQVYPATLAALGDAASALNLHADVHFLPPASLSAGLDELNTLHGVILPGGASMAVVAGQIRVAEATLRHTLPTLGLCLGMQSMATAAVRQNEGFGQAIPAEVAPDAPLHSFVAFEDGRHRCGVLPFTSSALPGAINEMHYNHRYRFNPLLIPQLAASGVKISAQTGDIVEGISQPALPFWHGVQGHPELLSRPGAPHPLFIAFLQAALNSPA